MVTAAELEERARAASIAALNEALEKMTASELSRRMTAHPGQKSCNRSAINQWKVKGIPRDRSRAFHEVTGIPLKRVRPDLYDSSWSKQAQDPETLVVG